MFGSFVVRRVFSSSARVTKIHLKKEYPLVFNYLHPEWQVEFEDKSIPEKSLLVWKCANGPDHEWKASVKNVVYRYKASKYNS